MPSVADELAELRKRFLAKQHGAKLQNAQGLSTPEQEQTALKDAQSKSRAATYTKDAAAQLQQGTKAVSQELDFSLKSSTQKKQEGLQKKQAAEQLKQGSKAVSQDLDFQMQQKALKQKDHQNKKDAAENLQSFNLTKSESQEDNNNNNKTEPTTTTTTTESVPENETHEAEDELEDIPVLEEVSGGASSTALAATMTDENQPPGPRVANRAEKKARKMMERLHMKAVPGIVRVTLKMPGNQGVYSITDASVYEKNGSYIVFGEARQQGGSSSSSQAAAQQAAVQQVAMAAAASSNNTNTSNNDTTASTPAVDETGLEAKDIELIMSQAGCSRAKAVTALQQNDGDLVNAIMSLTA